MKFFLIYILCLVNMSESYNNVSNYYCMDSWHVVEDDAEALLDCIDSVSNVSWRRGAVSWQDLSNKSPLPLNTGKYTLLENGSLTIKNVTSYDFGFYLCEFAQGTIKVQLHGINPYELNLWTYFLLSVIGVPFLTCMLFLISGIVKALHFKHFGFKKPFDHKNAPTCIDETDEPLKASSMSDDDDENPQNNTTFLNTAVNALDITYEYGKKKLLQDASFKKWRTLLIFFIVNFFICALDVFTDVIQAAIHFWNNDFFWSGLTLMFIILPFILSVAKVTLFQLIKKLKKERLEWKVYKSCLLHLPFIQIYKHWNVFMQMAKVQNLIETEEKKKQKAIKEQPEKKETFEDCFHHLKKKMVQEESEIVSNFQQFKVVECIGESTPQAILQIGIIFKQASHFKSAVHIISNYTILSSLLSIVVTFSGLYLKMPYGINTLGRRTSNKFKTRKCSANADKLHQQDNTLQFPFRTKKCMFLVVPIMFATVLPRIWNLGIMIAFEAYWIMLPVMAGYLVLYSLCYFTLHWSMGKQKLTWYLSNDLFLYSLALSIISPCIRFKPDSKSFILYSSLLSLGFHFLLLATMYGSMTFDLGLLYSCDTDVNIYNELFIASVSMLSLSFFFSILLGLLSDEEFRQLIGLCLMSPMQGPLSSPDIDVYKTAFDCNWLLVLKYLIKMDIDLVQGKTQNQALILLRKSGHINGNIRKKKTALHWACIQKKYEMAKMFLEAPAYLGHTSALDAGGQTPLHMICDQGDMKMAKLFFENSTHLKSINAIDKGNATPFIIACKKQHQDIIKLFLDAPNDELDHLNAVNNSNQSAFIVSCTKSDEKTVQLFTSSSCFESIDFSLKFVFNKTLWHLLAEKPNRLKIMELIEANASKKDTHINDQDNDGRSPYHYTILKNNIKGFKWFINESNKLGVDINAQDKCGMTDFHFACWKKSKEMIKLLLTSCRRGFIKNLIADSVKTVHEDLKQFTIVFKDSKKQENVLVKIDSLDTPTKIEITNQRI